MLDVLADGADDIALHDLHVVDVIEQFYARRVDAFDHLNTPRRVVALIILVVYLAVQKFQADGDGLVLRDLPDPVQAGYAIINALLVKQPAAVSGKGDHVGYAGRSSLTDVRAHFALDVGMIFFSVQAVGDGSAARGHGGYQTVLLYHRPFARIDQVDALQSDLGSRAGQVVQTYFVETPACN